ncbi:MAG: hypothetical protein B0D87_08190 [Candidatus Sedimenticola endophacoides]|nr:MAG: hypothetical protein B0D86_03395 [Candidatus Sedimenticola endophacoides]OQX47937.1 MAG: hypothetical protein B0D87_08190 [Candidatus Sedimenticola endophacoides]
MPLGPDLATLEPAFSGTRAERPVEDSGWLERVYRWLGGVFGPGRHAGRGRAARHFVRAVRRAGLELSALGAPALRDRVAEVRLELRRDGFTRRAVVNSFALIREIAQRELGQRHYDTQLLGGWLLLRGMVAEMPTGEGKTLTATLSAGTAALAGLPVHVLTVNDYLTERDAREMGVVYRSLGLSVGVVVHGQSSEVRQQAYSRDVVYCTSKELVFDYLRDRIELGHRRLPLQQRVEPLLGSAGRHRRLMTRGLHYAIVDEADSVLIDEARTPLIISGPGGGHYEQRFLQQGLDIAT